LLKAFKISSEPPPKTELILERIMNDE